MRACNLEDVAQQRRTHLESDGVVGCIVDRVGQLQQGGCAIGMHHRHRVAQPAAVARRKHAASRRVGEGSCTHRQSAGQHLAVVSKIVYNSDAVAD